MPFSFEDIDIIRYIINFVEEISFDLEEKEIKILLKIG